MEEIKKQILDLINIKDEVAIAKLFGLCNEEIRKEILNGSHLFQEDLLLTAINKGLKNTVKLFLPYIKGINYQQKGNVTTPLHCAVEIGAVDIVKILLESPHIDVNAKDKRYGHNGEVQGMPALHKAIGLIGISQDQQNTLLQIVKLLISDNRIDLESQDTWGRLPLDVANKYSKVRNEKICHQIAQILGWLPNTKKLDFNYAIVTKKLSGSSMTGPTLSVQVETKHDKVLKKINELKNEVNHFKKIHLENKNSADQSEQPTKFDYNFKN